MLEKYGGNCIERVEVLVVMRHSEYIGFCSSEWCKITHFTYIIFMFCREFFENINIQPWPVY